MLQLSIVIPGPSSGLFKHFGSGLTRKPSLPSVQLQQILRLSHISFPLFVRLLQFNVDVPPWLYFSNILGLNKFLDNDIMIKQERITIIIFK